MTNHPRRAGRRKNQRHARARAELLPGWADISRAFLLPPGTRVWTAPAGTPPPGWATDPAPGPSSSVRFQLAAHTAPPRRA